MNLVPEGRKGDGDESLPLRLTFAHHDIDIFVAERGQDYSRSTVPLERLTLPSVGHVQLLGSAVE